MPKEFASGCPGRKGADAPVNGGWSHDFSNPAKILALVTSLVLGAVGSANAELAPPRYAESCLLNSGADGAKDLVGVGLCNVVKGTAHLSSATSSAGVATAFADGTFVGFNVARATIDYAFSVDGPLNGVYVPVFVVTNMHVAVSPSFAAQAMLEVLSRDERDYLGQILDTSDAGPTADYSGALAFFARTGMVNTVSMSALVSLSSGRPVSGNAEASVDPYIYIDPGFLAGHPGYSVSVSPGFPNVPVPLPVPEPASWALFTVGFGMLSRRIAAHRVRSARRPSFS
ncbi:MAG TPA: PEP-CTERM sorting domain-containing protein [Rhodocyclaceae bacterium]|nr:PEP-CTERM sorting domain-containing protein [Rhodocyclaceae bacterium]